MWVIHFYASCQNYTSRDHIESRCKGLMLLYACLKKNKYKNLLISRDMKKNIKQT